MRTDGGPASGGDYGPLDHSVVGRRRHPLGLVALGDSITVGEGSMVLGVTPLSWAQWLARALDLPYTSYAVNGAVVADVLRDQLPLVRREYDIACLYAGVNDARDAGFDAEAYERDLLAVAEGLRERSDRLLLVTLPLRLGRPTAAPKPALANGAIRRVARSTGAALCELDDLSGWVEILPDAVHPTAVGQVVIADRAARALGAPVLPSAIAGLPVGGRDRLRHLPGHLRALLREAAQRLR
jgi:lysophospholipase L1-like esterase